MLPYWFLCVIYDCQIDSYFQSSSQTIWFLTWCLYYFSLYNLYGGSSNLWHSGGTDSRRGAGCCMLGPYVSDNRYVYDIVIASLLSETRKRFRTMLSSMSAATSTVTKWFFENISETVRASDIKIYRNVALNSLYISTRNDVMNYFRSEATRTNV